MQDSLVRLAEKQIRAVSLLYAVTNTPTHEEIEIRRLMLSMYGEAERRFTSFNRIVLYNAVEVFSPRLVDLIQNIGWTLTPQDFL